MAKQAKKKMTDEQKQYKQQYKDRFNREVSERLITLRDCYGIKKETFINDILEMCTDPETGNSITSRDTIDNYERGLTEIPGSILSIIANYYTEKTAKDGKSHRITVDFLLGRDTNPFEVDFQKQVEQYTGLTEAAFETLKSLNDHDNYIVALENCRLEISSNKKLYRSVVTSFNGLFLNFFLEHYDLLKRFINIFQKFAIPDQFDVPVRKVGNTYELLNDDIRLATDKKNLDDNIAVDFDSVTAKAIFKNELDIILNQYAAEFYEQYGEGARRKRARRQNGME